jgi:ankyrin repeat protein
MSKDFFYAIKQGNLDEVKHLFSINSSLIHEKENGLSSVMVALYSHNLEIADFLSTKIGTLSIFDAAAIGKTNQILRHLARDPILVNTYSTDGFQPLGLACFFGHFEAAEYLIKAGAGINSPSRNSLGTMPIHSAVSAGHLDIVMLLLKNNANPNVQESDGFTPLHLAAQNGNTKMIRSLLFNGADVTILNQHGEAPIDLATEAGHNDVVALFKEGITRRFRACVLDTTKN